MSTRRAYAKTLYISLDPEPGKNNNRNTVREKTQERGAPRRLSPDE